jgi:N-hydroxyarylamine O-acetyltransferase
VGVTEAYLERIGIDAAPDIDFVGLRRLHVAHLMTVPFENLDIHLGVPIVLRTDALVEKIAVRRRGGFCYELNGAFAWLLTSLGFPTTLLEARVIDATGGLGIRFDHLCLRVDLDRPYLVDVGFGENFLEPLILQPGREQVDLAGAFTIVERDDDACDLLRDGVAEYRFFAAPRQLEDFEPGCRFHQTSPDSHFTQGPVCTLPTSRGRITISGSTLIETIRGERSETTLDDPALLAAYRDRFGIELDRLPEAGPRTS